MYNIYLGSDSHSISNCSIMLEEIFAKIIEILKAEHDKSNHCDSDLRPVHTKANVVLLNVFWTSTNIYMSSIFFINRALINYFPSQCKENWPINKSFTFCYMTRAE